MTLKLIVQDNVKGTIYDLSELVTDISWSTQMGEQPGKLVFNYYASDKFTLSEGSPVSFKVDGDGVFFGYVFMHGRKKDGKIPVTAYDQTRYLKNSDTKVFSGMTSSQIFVKLCSDFNLKSKVVDTSNYVVAAKIHDNKTIYTMMQHGIDETLLNTGNYYFIKDDFGILKYVNLNSLKTKIVIGDKSLLRDYDFTSSIDEDTYNQVKLVKENKETNKREIYIVKNNIEISRWGILQYFETMDEKANAAQIQTRAEMILKLKNRATKKLKLPCLGNIGVSAGNGVVLSISDLVKEGVEKDAYFMVTSATHSFTKDEHTMDLEVQVSI